MTRIRKRSEMLATTELAHRLTRGFCPAVPEAERDRVRDELEAAFQRAWLAAGAELQRLAADKEHHS